MLENYQSYLLPAAISGFFVWRLIKMNMSKRKIPDLLSRGGVMVDVRSREEFNSGAAKQCLNIPLDQIKKDLGKLNPEKPVILCCASGTRSGMAALILKNNGFKEVVNVGSWTNLPL